MRFRLLTLYWLRILTATLALVLALLYLLGGEEIAIAGFILTGLLAAVFTLYISKGILPAICDLCDSHATIGTEYGAGYTNARLILHCPRCGRVVNSRPGSMKPKKE